MTRCKVKHKDEVATEGGKTERWDRESGSDVTMEVELEMESL